MWQPLVSSVITPVGFGGQPSLVDLGLSYLAATEWSHFRSRGSALASLYQAQALGGGLSVLGGEQAKLGDLGL